MLRPDYIEERIQCEADYIIETGSTVRATAKKLGVSKSTVHRDMALLLKDVSSSKYEDVAKVLAVNYNERQARGGQATKRKYEIIKQTGRK